MQIKRLIDERKKTHPSETATRETWIDADGASVRGVRWRDGRTVTKEMVTEIISAGPTEKEKDATCAEATHSTATKLGKWKAKRAELLTIRADQMTAAQVRTLARVTAKILIANEDIFSSLLTDGE